MPLETQPFDAADYLTDPESISAYLTDALESDEPAVITNALNTVARARGGVPQLAKESGLSPEVISNALGNTPFTDLGAVIKVMHALGVRLSASLVA